LFIFLPLSVNAPFRRADRLGNIESSIIQDHCHWVKCYRKDSVGGCRIL
jgi:hypothetical protein